MATYITSDAHGHVRALDRALELAGPSSRDVIYVVGDMIDRGPDPVGVLKLVRSLPHVHVLMGNHEQMLLDALHSEQPEDVMAWEMNGGYTTSSGLDKLPAAECDEIIAWIGQLPLHAVVEVDDLRDRRVHEAEEAPARRRFAIVHAGIDAVAARAHLDAAGIDPAQASVDELEDMLAHQSSDDLLWIRQEFWGAPTGLVDGQGRGPIVIAGHTPSILLSRYAVNMGGTGMDADGRGCMVEVGATFDTGGEPDRIDIDCSAAAGYPAGQVGIMRLEDGARWYAPVAEGE